MRQSSADAVNQLLTHRDHVLTPQSAATRARLVSTAEKLFADRGIESVTLAEINIAAGQRNKNATHYHFGDKDGLLQAIFDKHTTEITRRRERLLDEMEAGGTYSVASVVRALLYPLAEKLFDRDGGREFIRINAQLVGAHVTTLNGGTDLFNIGPLERLTKAKAHFLRHLPEAIAEQRVMLAIVLILHGLADHSRAIDRGAAEATSDTELFVRNLEDCLVALCVAPVSDVTRDALESAQHPPESPGGSKVRRRRLAK